MIAAEILGAGFIASSLYRAPTITKTPSYAIPHVSQPAPSKGSRQGSMFLCI